MRYSAKNYAQALMDALESAGPHDENRILDNFVQILAENNAIRMFEEIASEFHKLDLARKGIKQVEMTSAHPISKHTEGQILDHLNDLVRGEVEVSKQIDEQLIGGVVIRMEDRMLDASVKNSLEQLKNNLAE